MLKKVLIGAGIMVVLVVAGFFAGNWWIDTRLRQEIAEARAQASAAEMQMESARKEAVGEIKQAKDEMARWRQEADRKARENQQLIAERKALLDKLTATANALAQIREEALHVPASELLGRIRLALVALRGSSSGSGAPAH